MKPLTSQRTALIGHTGFVGGNLHRARQWDDCYNSKNIHELAGKSYDLVVCAGVSAVKWQANRNPEADWAGIQPLLAALGKVQARRFVLVSTIDVYPSPLLVDEDVTPALEACHPYGRHRLLIEQFVRERFDDALIVRLPGMFGPGLKKNAIYDLLHDNQVELIDPEAQFQFYDVRWAWPDIERARNAGLRLLNLSSEPVSMQTVAQRAFGRTLPLRDGPHARYDYRSRHAHFWGHDDGYLYSGEQVVAAVCDWVRAERVVVAGA